MSKKLVRAIRSILLRRLSWVVDLLGGRGVQCDKIAIEIVEQDGYSLLSACYRLRLDTGRARWVGLHGEQCPLAFRKRTVAGENESFAGHHEEPWNFYRGASMDLANRACLESTESLSLEYRWPRLTEGGLLAPAPKCLVFPEMLFRVASYRRPNSARSSPLRPCVTISTAHGGPFQVGGIFAGIGGGQQAGEYLQGWVLRTKADSSAGDPGRYGLVTSDLLRELLPAQRLGELEEHGVRCLQTLESWTGTGPVGHVLLAHAQDLTGAPAIPLGSVIVGNQVRANTAGQTITIEKLVYALTRVWVGTGMRLTGHRARDAEEGIATALTLRYLREHEAARYATALTKVRYDSRSRSWQRTLESLNDGIRYRDAAALGLVWADDLEIDGVLRTLCARIRESWGCLVSVENLVGDLGRPLSLSRVL